MWYKSQRWWFSKSVVNYARNKSVLTQLEYARVFSIYLRLHGKQQEKKNVYMSFV